MQMQRKNWVDRIRWEIFGLETVTSLWTFSSKERDHFLTLFAPAYMSIEHISRRLPWFIWNFGISDKLFSPENELTLWCKNCLFAQIYANKWRGGIRGGTMLPPPYLGQRGLKWKTRNCEVVKCCSPQQQPSTFHPSSGLRTQYPWRFNQISRRTQNFQISTISTMVLDRHFKCQVWALWKIAPLQTAEFSVQICHISDPIYILVVSSFVLNDLDILRLPQGSSFSANEIKFWSREVPVLSP